MTILATGKIHKLSSSLSQPIEYRLPIGESEIPLNVYLGKTVTLTFIEIQCLYCKKTIKKSFNQGYCFPCAQKLARCDLCILKPETCHYHLGTCREPDWGQRHCFIPHIVYLANTSGLKVGIARETQIPTRWIDQGAIQAIPLFRVQNRYHSGLLEAALKIKVQDKTNWRKMLSGEGEILDLEQKRTEVLNEFNFLQELKDPHTETLFPESLIKDKSTRIYYPVLKYPHKVTSLNAAKSPVIQGTLLGIKGQYLLFDIGVLNIRNLGGHVIELSL